MVNKYKTILPIPHFLDIRFVDIFRPSKSATKLFPKMHAYEVPKVFSLSFFNQTQDSMYNIIYHIGRVMESLIRNWCQRELETLLVLLGYEPAYAYANFYD